MILEERIYTFQFGKVGEWLTFYEERGLPIQTRLLGRLIGMFQTEIGTLNQVVHLWSYDSLAHREECRTRLASDPGWHDYLRDVPKTMLSMENRILTPVRFSPLR